MISSMTQDPGKHRELSTRHRNFVQSQSLQPCGWVRSAYLHMESFPTSQSNLNYFRFWQFNSYVSKFLENIWLARDLVGMEIFIKQFVFGPLISSVLSLFRTKNKILSFHLFPPPYSKHHDGSPEKQIPKRYWLSRIPRSTPKTSTWSFWTEPFLTHNQTQEIRDRI